MGGYRDVLILPRVPRGEIDTHRDPFPFPFPSPFPFPLPLFLRRALSRVFARDGLALIDLARLELSSETKKKGGEVKKEKEERRKKRASPILVPLPKNWMISRARVKSRDTRIGSMRELLDLVGSTLGMTIR